MTTTARPSIFSLPPDERRAVYEAAYERVAETSREIVAARKAQIPDPHLDSYREWRTLGLVCALVVKHRDASASFEVSRDGGPGSHLYLPKSKTAVLPESDGDFLMVLIPRSFVKWIAAKDPVAGQRFRELLGVTLPLAAGRTWTDAECETWTRLDRRRMSINARIQSPRRRREYSTIKRRDAA